MQIRRFLVLISSTTTLMGLLTDSCLAQPDYGLRDSGPPPRSGNYPHDVAPVPLNRGTSSGQYQQLPQNSAAPYQGSYGFAAPQGNYAGFIKPPQTQSQTQISPQQAARVYQWFLNYDEIRRRAQMNPIEKQQADGLLARGLGILMPGQDKQGAKQLLSMLTLRYQAATQSLQSLAVLPETRILQSSYYDYFNSAAHLFSDYLRVQENVFAVDNSGQSIAKQLIQRKMMLENLEQSCKSLDDQMRRSFGIPAYQY